MGYRKTPLTVVLVLEYSNKGVEKVGKLYLPKQERISPLILQGPAWAVSGACRVPSCQPAGLYSPRSP